MTEHQGKVAFITGGARGQGRSHAQALASKGANIALLDVCQDLEGIPYSMATEEQLEETKALVEKEGVSCLTFKADTRSLDDVQAAVDKTVQEFGQVDYLLANAGVASISLLATCTPEIWNANLSINLTGTFNTFRAVIPHMIERSSGKIIATGSVAGRAGMPNGNSYSASKWGVISLVKTAAVELGMYGITVNAICPTNVSTDMFLNDMIYRTFRPDLESPTYEDIDPAAKGMHPMGVPYIEPSDVTSAVLFLLGESGRYISGEALHISLGQLAMNTA